MTAMEFIRPFLLMNQKRPEALGAERAADGINNTFIGGVQLTRVDTVKDLEVIFDSRLNLKQHIATLARSLRQQTGQACRFAR